MNYEPEDPIWQRLSKALLGGRKTTDEGLFTYRVMLEIRGLSKEIQDLAWPRFLRWAFPALGVGVASLVLATRTPISSTPLLMETVLFQQQLLDEDSLSIVLSATESSR